MITNATGGSITYIEIGDTTYAVHTFTSSGTFSITSGSGNVEYLLVGGGGGGGYNSGGGGGAGGLLTGTLTRSPDTYSVVVGAGGAGGIGSAQVGGNGGNSTVFGFSATGGGGGGAYYTSPAGSSGGSGGGAARGGGTGGSGVSGQGYAGGTTPATGVAGGGGGAAAAGAAGGTLSTNGLGGAGTASSITGTETYYAGGGGAAGREGGIGGGGAGAYSGAHTHGTPGTNGLGGGGGGGSSQSDPNNYNGGAGGSGVVILRYPVTDIGACYFEIDSPFSTINVLSASPFVARTSIDHPFSSVATMVRNGVPASVRINSPFADIQVTASAPVYGSVTIDAPFADLAMTVSVTNLSVVRIDFPFSDVTVHCDISIFAFLAEEAWALQTTTHADTIYRLAERLRLTTVSPLTALLQALASEQVSLEDALIYLSSATALETFGASTALLLSTVLTLTERIRLNDDTATQATLAGLLSETLMTYDSLQHIWNLLTSENVALSSTIPAPIRRVYQAIRERLRTSDATVPSITLLASALEQLSLDDRVVFLWSLTLGDSFATETDSAAQTHAFRTLSERLHLTATPLAVMTLVAYASESLTLTDRIWLTANLLAATGVDLASESSASTKALLLAAEMLRVASGTSTALAIATRLAEALLVRDTLRYVADATAQDTLALADQLSQAITAQFTAPEALAFSAALRTSLVVLISESFDLTDGALPSIQAMLRAVESLAFIGELELPEGTFSAWVMNADTTGTTSYSSFPFNSLFTHKGVSYGVTEAGLYELTGDTDDGDPIEAIIRTGDIGFGTTRDKFVPRAYLYLLSSGQTVLKTISSRAGARTERIYELAPRTGNDDAVRRVSLARGLRGVAWAFELRNVDGADFNFSGAEVLPVPLTRRG